jgi:transposase
MLCPAGQVSYRRSRFNNKRDGLGTTYFFDPKLCQSCPLRNGWHNGQRIGRSVTIFQQDPAIQAARQRESTPEFRREYKLRSAIEHKFGELKGNFGLSRARYRGLLGVTIQAVHTAFAANIKRMVRLQEAKGGLIGARFSLRARTHCKRPPSVPRGAFCRGLALDGRPSAIGVVC